MKRSLILAATLGVMLTAAAKDSQNGSGETDGYKLVWQDLFDGTALDTKSWSIEVNGDGGGNAELQYYTTENVSVGDDGQGNGCLILTAKRETYNNKEFTSGRLNTKGKFAFKHGKVEASIKLPVTANGLWPAFWMMGNDFDKVGWPASGETDIMEFGHQNGIKAGTSDRYFNGASHWGTAWDNKGDKDQSATWDYSLQDGEFHLWTCIWDENAMSMYCDLDKYPDRAPYYTIDISKVDPAEELCAGNFFHKENFIIFNLAVGGHFPGIYNADGITALNDANGNSASMYINYVKVYQKGVDSESITIPDGTAEPDPTPDPEPDPEPTEWVSAEIWQDATLSLTKTYYNPDPNWGAESNDLTCSIENDKMTFDIPRQTYALWQAQFFIETGLPMKAENKYDFSFNLTSTTTGTGQCKLLQSGDDGNFHFCDMLDFTAGETKNFSWEGLTGKDFTNTMVIFDFGLVPDNTHVEVTDIHLTEWTPKSSGLDEINVTIPVITLQGDEIAAGDDAVIVVYDLSGRVVAGGTATGTLNVAQLPSGVYVVKATGAGATATCKIIR